jgi:hypothetical protein
MTFDPRNIISDPGESIDAANARLYAGGFTDGLPVVPPTRARVDAMLRGRDPTEHIAELAPLMASATREAIACCAVMAGCLPEYMPVLEAAVAGAGEPQFNLLGVQTTTGSAAVCMIVNGPVVERLGINYAGNALGPGVRAIAALGRALALTLRNVGGAVPGELDMATLGQPGKYTFCFAENERENPWEPLHVTRGYVREDSTVTVFAVAGTMEVRDDCSGSAEELLKTFALSMTASGSAGTTGMLTGGEAMILLAPDHAAVIAKEKSRKQAQASLFETAQLPASVLSREKQKHLESLGIGPDTRLLVARSPDDILLLVVGGTGFKSAYIPSWGGGSRSVTRRIEA